MSDYNPMTELELPESHPTSTLIEYAIVNYGWELLQEYDSVLLTHTDFRKQAARWRQALYHEQTIMYPNWFKQHLKEQIEKRKIFLSSGKPENPPTMEQTGQGWAEPPEVFDPEALNDPLVGMHFESPVFTADHQPIPPLRQIQNEIMDWAMQFEDNPSHDSKYSHICLECHGLGVVSVRDKSRPRTAWDKLPEAMLVDPCPECKGTGAIRSALHSLPPLMGMCEEIGELQGATCKRHQGRGFMDDNEYHGEVMDCLADIMIFMCDYANREGIDLISNLQRVWDKVKNRSQKTWAEDKSKEEPNSALVKVELPPLHKDFKASKELLEADKQIMEQASKKLAPVLPQVKPKTIQVKNPDTLSKADIDASRAELSKFVREERQYLDHARFDLAQNKADLMDEDVEFTAEFDPGQKMEERIKNGEIPAPTQDIYKNWRTSIEADEEDDVFRCGACGAGFPHLPKPSIERLQPTDDDLCDRLIETIDNADLWEEVKYRNRLYQSVSAIGLQYGDQNLTNIEEGLLKKLMLVAEDAEARLHGLDAKQIREKLNEIRKLRPDILGETKKPLGKKPKLDYDKE